MRNFVGEFCGLDSFFANRTGGKRIFGVAAMSIIFLSLATLIFQFSGSNVLCFGDSPSRNQTAYELLEDGSEHRVERSFILIHKDVDAFVKRSRTAASDEELADAVYDMCRLHHEIVNDARFARSKDLQGYRRVLWGRLGTVKSTIERRVARDSKEIEKNIRKLQRDGTINAETANKMRREALGGDDDTMDESEPSYGDFTGISDRLAEQMSIANQFTGGPSQIFAYASGRPAGPPDYGPDLVRLIEETVKPEFWERNGGPGRIHYYKPLRIIVVGGTIQVQDNVQRLLKNLRMLDR